MENTASAKLYSPRLLALAIELANYPLDQSLEQRGEARSRTCGSTAAIGFRCADDGEIVQIGMQVTACAVGQASAALMGRSVAGKTAADLGAALMGIERWLAGKGALPLSDWPGLDALEPALVHPARHGALLLPWKAAAEALCLGVPTR